MKTFKIQNGDLVFDGQNNLAMVEGREEEGQAIERALTTNKGEWFLNLDHGLEYAEIQGKGRDKEGIRLAVTEAIHQDDRVEDIEGIDIDINRAARRLEVKCKVKIITGHTLQEVIAIE